MHIIGSVWYLITSVDKVWIPPKDFIYAGQADIYRFWYPDTEIVETYLVSLYSAVIALGGNEMGPRTDMELLLIFIILFSVTFYNAHIFGEMTVLVQASSKKTTDFQS